jgi:hypothetical protein
VPHNPSSARGGAWHPATQVSSSFCHEGPICRLSISRGLVAASVATVSGGPTRVVIGEGIQGGA